MRYQISFHDTDRFSGDVPDLVFYGQNQPLIPRIGELIRVDKGPRRQVKEIEYLYEKTDSIRIMITTGDPK